MGTELTGEELVDTELTDKERAEMPTTFIVKE